MLAILLGLFRLIWPFGRSQDAVALENLTLHQQLAIYKRKKKRPRLIRRDRWDCGFARALVYDATGSVGKWIL
jgi:hypothetical protein